jgi:hypothetical protein
MVVKGLLNELAVSGLNMSSKGASLKVEVRSASGAGSFCVMLVDQNAWLMGDK